MHDITTLAKPRTARCSCGKLFNGKNFVQNVLDHLQKPALT